MRVPRSILATLFSLLVAVGLAVAAPAKAGPADTLNGAQLQLLFSGSNINARYETTCRTYGSHGSVILRMDFAANGTVAVDYECTSVNPADFDVGSDIGTWKIEYDELCLKFKKPAVTYYLRSHAQCWSVLSEKGRFSLYTGSQKTWDLSVSHPNYPTNDKLIAALEARAEKVAATKATASVTLPPAEYKPLPVGTVIRYDDRSHEVVRTEGLATVFKTISGRGLSYLTFHALFGESGDDLYVFTDRGVALGHTIEKADERKIESLWPLEVGKQATYRIHQEGIYNTPPETWTITLRVSRTDTVELNGLRYDTYVIEEKAETLTEPKMSFVGRKWYHPPGGVVIKAERTWTGAARKSSFYSTTVHFLKGQGETYELATVSYPEGTMTHALKGTPVESEADKELLAEVERLRQALAARSDAGAAAPVPAAVALGGIDFGRYHALVIGIDDYKHLPKLKTAVNDARAVARVLGEDYGFRVRTLINPDDDGLIDALDEYRETLGPKDNLLIYYAGHGWLDEEVDRGYWLPVNAQPKRRSGWVSNATITDTLKGLAAKHVMVVADSCYSGTLVRGADLAPRTRSGGYWKQMAEKFARVAITSGGLEPVADKGGGGHSPFAKAFVDALEDNAGVIDGTQLFTRMRRPVMVAAKQTPQYADVREAGHDGGDFLFVRRK